MRSRLLLRSRRARRGQARSGAALPPGLIARRACLVGLQPRGPDGSPQRIFDRATGSIDPVAAAWQRDDIRRTLEQRWAALGPKIHISVGGAGSFHLEESVKLLCDFLVQKGSNASCEIIPDRHQFNLYEEHPSHPDGLFQRILAETQQRASEVSVRGAP